MDSIYSGYQNLLPDPGNPMEIEEQNTPSTEDMSNTNISSLANNTKDPQNGKKDNSTQQTEKEIKFPFVKFNGKVTVAFHGLELGFLNSLARKDNDEIIADPENWRYVLCKTIWDDCKLQQAAEYTVRFQMLSGSIADLTNSTEAVNVWNAIIDWEKFKSLNEERASQYKVTLDQYQAHCKAKEELNKQLKYQFIRECQTPPMEIDKITYFLTFTNRMSLENIGNGLETLMSTPDYSKRLDLATKLIWREGEFQLRAWKPDIKLLPTDYGGYILMAQINSPGHMVGSNAAVACALEGLLDMVKEDTKIKWMSVIGWLTSVGKNTHINQLCTQCPTLAFSTDDLAIEEGDGFQIATFEHLNAEHMRLSSTNLDSNNGSLDIRVVTTILQKTHKFYTTENMIGYITGPVLSNISFKITSAIEQLTKNILKAGRNTLLNTASILDNDLAQKEALINNTKLPDALATHVLFSSIHQTMRSKREELVRHLTRIATEESWLLASEADIRIISEVDHKRWSYDQCHMRMGVIIKRNLRTMASPGTKIGHYKDTNGNSMRYTVQLINSTVADRLLLEQMHTIAVWRNLGNNASIVETGHRLITGLMARTMDSSSVVIVQNITHKFQSRKGEQQKQAKRSGNNSNTVKVEEYVALTLCTSMNMKQHGKLLLKLMENGAKKSALININGWCFEVYNDVNDITNNKLKSSLTKKNMPTFTIEQCPTKHWGCSGGGMQTGRH